MATSKESFDPTTQHVLTQIVFEHAPHIEQGLYSGVLTTHIYPQTQEFRIATALRSVCDAFVGITLTADRTAADDPRALNGADITLTHFKPTRHLREGHTETIREAATTHQPGIRFALLLVALPITRYSSEEAFIAIRE